MKMSELFRGGTLEERNLAVARREERNEKIKAALSNAAKVDLSVTKKDFKKTKLPSVGSLVTRPPPILGKALGKGTTDRRTPLSGDNPYLDDSRKSPEFYNRGNLL